jgi:hypothetical protein
MSHTKNIQGKIMLYIFYSYIFYCVFDFIDLSDCSKNCDENGASRVEHERNYHAFKIKVYLSG